MRWKLHGICFAGPRKNSFAYYPALCFLHLCDVPYPFRHLWGITLCRVVWCLSILLLGDRVCFSYSGHPGSIMWFVTGRIRGDGNNRRQQSPEFLLVNLGILTTSFYKQCCWQWPSDIRLMQVGCSCGSEVPLVLVSLFGNADSDLKVSCSILTQQASTQRFNWWTLLDQWPLVTSATRSIGLRRSILALLILQRIYFFLLKRLILMAYTMKVILP